MKNTIKVFGIISLVLVIGFSMAGCDNGSTGDGDGSGGPVYFGDTLELSGQVYLENWNEAGTSFSYSKFTGNLAISGYGVENGNVENGQLTCSIGAPYLSESELVSYFDMDYHGNMYDEVTFSENVRSRVIWGFYLSDGWLDRGKTSIRVGKNSASSTEEYIDYIYVENDVTVSGKGKTETRTEEDGTYTTKGNNFTLDLKAGWNAVYVKESCSYTFTGTIENPSNLTATRTVITSLSNPSSLRWVYTSR
jgi:hypothetical protein